MDIEKKLTGLANCAKRQPVALKMELSKTCQLYSFS